jgi:hypothetical protein
MASEKPQFVAFRGIVEEVVSSPFLIDLRVIVDQREKHPGK